MPHHVVSLNGSQPQFAIRPGQIAGRGVEVGVPVHLDDAVGVPVEPLSDRARVDEPRLISASTVTLVLPPWPGAVPQIVEKAMEPCPERSVQHSVEPNDPPHG
jgi:hypothetical protein